MAQNCCPDNAQLLFMNTQQKMTNNNYYLRISINLRSGIILCTTTDDTPDEDRTGDPSAQNPMRYRSAIYIDYLYWRSLFQVVIHLIFFHNAKDQLCRIHAASQQMRYLIDNQHSHTDFLLPVFNALYTIFCGHTVPIVSCLLDRSHDRCHS